MNNNDAGISLRPVVIGGFQLSTSDKPFYITIKYEGRECDYLYYWSERPKTQDKYEKELAKSLQDFIYAAKVGCGDKDAYIFAVFCCGGADVQDKRGGSGILGKFRAQFSEGLGKTSR